MVKPTIIKTNDNSQEHRKPTVIRVAGHEEVPEEKKEELRPSRIPEKHLKSSDPETELSNAKVSSTYQPTSMAGHKRDRLPITIDEVNAEFTEMSDQEITQILQLIWETDFEALLESSALQWQEVWQKSYSQKVMNLLNLTQHESLARAQARTQRVIEILEAIDLHGVCEFNKDGVFTRFLKSANNEYDTPEELLEAELELKQLIQFLNNEIDSLVLLKKELTSTNREIESAAQKIKLATAAAHFLGKYFLKKGGKMELLGNQFEQRAMSLTKTLAQIKSNEITRETQINHVLKLIATIQESILIMIPDWLGSISGIRSLLEMRKLVTKTEIMNLSDQKKNILKHLK